MKKYSSQKRKNLLQIWNNKRVINISLVAILALSLAFWSPAWLSSIGSFIFSPFVKVETWLNDSTDTIPVFLRSRLSMKEDIENLESKLAEYANDHIRVASLKAENENLRNLFSASSSKPILASVTSRPSDLPYDVLLIDQGSSKGVKNRAPVYANNNQVIGFVGSVYKNKSLVVLASTPGLESTAYIYGPDIYTTAVGIGGGTLRVDVPQGIEIAKGDPVILPMLNAGIYGEITLVESKPTRPEQYAYVSTEIPMKSLRYVSVGKESIADLSFEEAKEAIGKVRADILDANVPNGILVEVATSTSTTTPTTTEQIEE